MGRWPILPSFCACSYRARFEKIQPVALICSSGKVTSWPRRSRTPDAGDARIRKQGVIEAGDEERDAHPVFPSR
jgi:hypothetical protein